MVQKTNYTWDGKVLFEVNPSTPVQIALKMRIPGWCKNYSVNVNGEKITKPLPENGYFKIFRTWKPKDQVTLEFDMQAEMVAADLNVKENLGKRAIVRGPLVYCMEHTDNDKIKLGEVLLGSDLTFKNEKGTGKLENMVSLKTKGDGQKLTFLPYFAWDNRASGEMKVWINYRNQ